MKRPLTGAALFVEQARSVSDHWQVPDHQKKIYKFFSRNIEVIFGKIMRGAQRIAKNLYGSFYSFDDSRFLPAGCFSTAFTTCS
jgi:hypothetical protein